MLVNFFKESSSKKKRKKIWANPNLNFLLRGGGGEKGGGGEWKARVSDFFFTKHPNLK